MAARAMSKGCGRNPTIQGPSSPDQGRRRSKQAIRLPHLCRTTNTITSHGAWPRLTLASSTGFGGVGSDHHQLWSHSATA